MTRSGNSLLLVLWICYISLVMQMSLAHDHNTTMSFKSITPLFVFGDSLLDSGNNNYFKTTIRANYTPYGMTYFHNATGRFSDGRTMADFIAEFANLTYIHPYLENVNEPSFTGVNFASAGSAAQVHIFNGSVIPLKQQVEYFKKVKLSLTKKLGKEDANTLISKAVYFVSIGGNDILSLFIFPGQLEILLKKVSFEQYTDFIVGNLTTNIKELYCEGARKFAVLGIDALGCQPGMREMNSAQGIEGCIENTTKLSQLFNKALIPELEKLSKELQGFKYSYLDTYTLIDNILSNPSKYGLKEVLKACCGRGKFRGMPSCGGQRPEPVIGREFTLCNNPQDYLYFDAGHFTEKANKILAEAFWNGSATIPGSYTMQQLFQLVN